MGEHWYDREARENKEKEDKEPGYREILKERYGRSMLKKPGRNTGY